MTSNYKTIAIVLGIIAIISTTSLAVVSFQNTNEKNIATPHNMMKNNSSKSTDMMHGGGHMNMAEDVTDDKSFIENMIPHHQEAVDTSKIVLSKTQDQELKNFTQQVITAQEKEIADMKKWYQDWFNSEYKDTGNYQPMMRDLNNLSGENLDKTYIRDMIMHHRGAIQMAEKVNSITERNELKELAANIINSQSTEVNTLMNWLMVKYNDHMMH